MPVNSIDPGEICELEAAAALPPLPPGVVAGALVAARGQRWRIEAAIDREDCRELHLRAAAGTERRVLLWPFDRPLAAGGRARLRVLPSARWTKYAGAALGRQLDPLVPRSPFSGEILPYQLAPAIAMAAGVSRVLLADEVGLGKTIQAGWILADLLARDADARALIAVPASLREQWASELAAFFSLAPERVDAAWLRAAASHRPADVSPWAAPGAYLGSIDFLKRPDVARSLTTTTWDLVVVDEAHGAVAPTERYAALSAVTAAARRVVIITATPCSGDAAAFASMSSLGARPGEPPPLMFRRSREDVGDRRARRQRFATVRIGRAEARFQRLLERYSRDVWLGAPDGEEGARLAMTVLRKRALSSPAAALRSLTRRLDLLRGTIRPPRQLSLFEDPAEPDDAMPDAALATPGLADRDREQRWLGALIEAATRATADDSKQRCLLRLVARIPREAIIVFTEYRDTLRQLAAVLPGALHLHGGLASAERVDVQRRFNEDGGVLLATDAAADGLNLQRRCRLIVNYELPWNPARLEQRIGRVDRIGQRRSVHAITLVARDTAEDLVVAALTRRLARVAATLGERDRLAALLSDARTARAVIAGVPPDVQDAAPAMLPAVRADASAYPVERVARALASVAALRQTTPVVVLARLHASAVLPPGWLAIVRARSVTDRGVVAERPFIVHTAAARIPKPSSQQDARAAARAVMPIVESAMTAHREVRAWHDEMVALQGAIVDLRLAREEALCDAFARAESVQPGLFDARALLQAARLTDQNEQRRREHTRCIRALEDGRCPRLECVVEALLIVWR